MTAPADEAPPVEVTPENANKLKARAYDLFARADALSAAGSLALAQSGIIWRVLSAEADLENADQQLAAACDELARANAAYEPKAAELNWVDQEIRSVVVSDDAPVKKRVEARTRLAALADERERLAPVVAQLGQAVTDARTQVENHQLNAIDHFRRELAQAESALRDPPLHDFAELVEVSYDTAQMIAIREGVARLLSTDDKTRGSALLMVMLAGMFGSHLQIIKNQWAKDLLDRADPKTKQGILRALNPPEPVRYEQQGRVHGGVPSDGAIYQSGGSLGLNFQVGIPEVPGLPAGRALPGAQG